MDPLNVPYDDRVDGTLGTHSVPILEITANNPTWTFR